MGAALCPDLFKVDLIWSLGWFDKLFGGAESFEEELKLGMAETLGKIKRAAESN